MIQSILWLMGLCLSFSMAQESHPAQKLTMMDLKSHFADQAVFSEISASQAVSQYWYLPLTLNGAVFRLYDRSLKKPVVEMKLLKAEYSLHQSRVLIQGSETQPDLLLVIDLRDGTIYDPSQGLKTFVEYFHLPAR